MKQRRRGEALLVASLLAGGTGLMALLDGAHELMAGFGWGHLALALGGAVLLFFSLLVALFLLYQMDRLSGRILKPIALFEVEPATESGEPDG